MVGVVTVCPKGNGWFSGQPKQNYSFQRGNIMTVSLTIRYYTVPLLE